MKLITKLFIILDIIIVFNIAIKVGWWRNTNSLIKVWANKEIDNKNQEFLQSLCLFPHAALQPSYRNIWIPL